MITICQSDAIFGTLMRATKVAPRLRALSVSTPFLDDFGLNLLARVDRGPAALALRLMTCPDNAGLLAKWSWRRLRVHFVRGLHAKVYASLAFDRRQHEAIVTSANLTRAGLQSNLELGLMVTGSTPEFATLAERVESWTHQTPPHSFAGMVPARR
jgi:hypothetical protein